MEAEAQGIACFVLIKKAKKDEQNWYRAFSQDGVISSQYFEGFFSPPNFGFDKEFGAPSWLNWLSV